MSCPLDVKTPVCLVSFCFMNISMNIFCIVRLFRPYVFLFSFLYNGLVWLVIVDLTINSLVHSTAASLPAFTTASFL